MEKLSKLLETHESFSCYSVIRKDKRECMKKEKIWQSAAKLNKIFCSEGSETIMRASIFSLQNGGWDSPFPLEIEGTRRTLKRGCNSRPRNTHENIHGAAMGVFILYSGNCRRLSKRECFHVLKAAGFGGGMSHAKHVRMMGEKNSRPSNKAIRNAPSSGMFSCKKDKKVI